ncbi:MAG: hypothetical protein ABI763_11150 [Bacteroidota bacterium]
MCRKILYLLFFLCCNQAFVVAQNTSVKQDSAKIYRDIEAYSKKRKTTNFLYRIFFKPTKTESAPANKKRNKKVKPKPYSYFEGKIIRSISVDVLDPFGFNLEDTVFVRQNFLYRAGNFLHKKTLSVTVKNLLLFHKNQPFDSLLVKESERLIRTQKYVHEVVFKQSAVGTNSDSVDILIRVLDEWSIIPAVAISTSAFEIKLTENNFLGTGHQFLNDFLLNNSIGKNAFKTFYAIPNINNTYINAAILYTSDVNRNTIKSINVDRPFFSPFAKWASGVFLTEQLHQDSIKLPDSSRVLQRFKFVTQDYWAGKSWQLFRGNSEDSRTTNLILTTRFIQTHFVEKPNEFIDTLHVYADQFFYLGGIGISTRKYVKDQYVFNFGVTEDVPIGKTYGLVGGYQQGFTSRIYLGIKFSKGNYFSKGYLSTSLEYGSFIHGTHFEQGAVILSANYFTDLIEIGKWKFRQFIYPQATFGINRFPGDNLSINGDAGIKGFDSYGLEGTHKLLLKLQTQCYAPWNILGFHFGPYFIYSMAMLGNQRAGFKNSHLYSQFGLGVLVKNEFLVFGIFQFSFAFYPVIPGNGNSIFKYDPDKTSDIGFRDFSISKPGAIGYQ